MKFGYARVSTQDQNLHLQLDALTKAGCREIFQEKASGKNTDRPELTRLLSQIRPGDTVVIWKLDRLGRSLPHLVELMESFREKGVELVSLHDALDTTTATGRLTFNIFASLAQFERELIRERTLAGLAAARARGRTGGRPRGLSPANQKKREAAQALKAIGKPVSEIATSLGLSLATTYRYLETA